MKPKVYLDNCCFNRPFDDQTSLVINIETLSKLYIQSKILFGTYELIWSDIIEYENSKNPFKERSKRISKWKNIASVYIQSTPDVVIKSKEIMSYGIKTKDALHLASAIKAGADYFLTTDKEIIKKAKNIEGIEILNPVDFIKEKEI